MKATMNSRYLFPIMVLIFAGIVSQHITNFWKLPLQIHAQASPEELASKQNRIVLPPIQPEFKGKSERWKSN